MNGVPHRFRKHIRVRSLLSNEIADLDEIQILDAVPGPTVDNVPVNGALPIAMDEGVVLAVGLRQLVVEEFSIARPIELVPRFQQAVPGRVPLWTEAGYWIERSKSGPGPRTNNQVGELERRRERLRFIPIRERFFGLKNRA